MTDSTTILRGFTDFAITLPKEVRRRGSLDTVEQTFQTGRRDAYRIDDAKGGLISRFPGYNTMFLDEIERTLEIPGRAYEQRLKGLGLLDGKDKIISDPISQSEDGFDTGDHELYTVDPSKYKLKGQHPLIPSLYITDRNIETEIGTIKKLRVSYKGIVPVEFDILGNPIPKGYKRRIGSSSSTQETSGVVPIYYFVPGTGWVIEVPSKRYRFDASRIQVTDSYVSFTPPDYNRLPSNWQPPDTPSTITTTTGLSLIVGSSGAAAGIEGEIIYNRPWGWVLRAYNVEQIFDLPVWLYSLTAEWVPEIEIKL